MPSARDIIREAESLPVEERAIVADSILRTLNRPDPAIDREWLAVARRRLNELRSGGVTPVPGNEVFSKVRERFEK
ncbi:MAG: addiction module protein [Phycisphaerae bacterium]